MDIEFSSCPAERRWGILPIALWRWLVAVLQEALATAQSAALPIPPAPWTDRRPSNMTGGSE